MASDKKLRKQQSVEERKQKVSGPARDDDRKYKKLGDVAREAVRVKRAERPDPLA